MPTWPTIDPRETVTPNNPDDKNECNLIAAKDALM
jgi:hypothetical protein